MTESIDMGPTQHDVLFNKGLRKMHLLDRPYMYNIFLLDKRSNYEIIVDLVFRLLLFFNSLDAFRHGWRSSTNRISYIEIFQNFLFDVNWSGAWLQVGYLKSMELFNQMI